MFARRTWLAVGIMLVAPALASAQLNFAHPSTFLGELRAGPAVQHRFEFVNTAPTALEIVDIRLGCGCLHPVLDKRTFQPGEKGTLVMHVRTLGQPTGTRTWQAHILYQQAGVSHEVALTIAATIRNEVTVEPSILAMTVETTLKQEVTITDHRAKPAKVTAAVASTPAVRVSVQPLAGGVTKVLLEVSRAALPAPTQEVSLNIYLDDPYYRHLQVPITLTKASQAPASATPDKVELIGVGSKLVRIRATGGRAVRISQIESDHPSIRCTWAPGPGNDATVNIRANAAPTAIGSATANVRVFLAEPTATIVTIPVELRKD